MRKIIIVLIILGILITGSISFASGKAVEVIVPDFNIEINGEVIDNQHNPYPFLSYNYVTYVPMTADYCRSLGLTISWDDPARIFSITKNNKYFNVNPTLTANNDINETYIAEICDYNISLNGESIDNGKEAYPILLFRDIVYFPLTYSYSQQLGLITCWDDVYGLKIYGDAPFIYDETIIDDWLYYVLDYNLYKVQTDGSQLTLIAGTGDIYDMLVSDDWIYYINGDDDENLYKIKNDGSEKIRLLRCPLEDLVGVYNDRIYYLPKQDFDEYLDSGTQLHSVRTDGKNQKRIDDVEISMLSFPVIIDGWIYYNNYMDNEFLYKARLDGSELKNLGSKRCMDYRIKDDTIYFTPYPTEYGNNQEGLFIMDLDGNNMSKILDETIYYDFDIENDWLYYGNCEDNNRFYKAKLDGSVISCINGDMSEIIKASGNKVYYIDSLPKGYGQCLKIVVYDIETGETTSILPYRTADQHCTDGQIIENNINR